MQTRSKKPDLLHLEDDIEKRFQRLSKWIKDTKENFENSEKEEIMAAEDQKTLRDYATPKVMELQSSITRPTIAANTFEIKPGTIQMIQNSVQFGGLANDDPIEHLVNFLEICDIFRYNGVSDDAVRFRLFPFTLQDKAKSWLHSLPPGSITTWDDLAQKFLAKFFPPAKTAKMRNEITMFEQQHGESLYEAWERYTELLRKCPHHGLPKWLQMNTFYNGLSGSLKTSIDAASGGAFMAKSYEEAYDLIETMAANYQWPTVRMTQLKVAGVLEVDGVTALTTQISALSKKMDALTSAQTQQVAYVCELCAGEHPTDHCAINPTSVQFVGSYNRIPQNMYQNAYNPGNMNHPNFSWSNNHNQQAPRPSYPQGFQNQHQQAAPQQEKKTNLEELLLKYISGNEASMKSQAASIKNLENQMGQLALALNNRPQGTLPSDTEKNPRGNHEQCNAITLSVKSLGADYDGKASTEEVCENEENDLTRKTEEKFVEKLKEDKQQIITPPVPFPQRLESQKLKDQFSRFMDIFKQFHINIPFVEALEQMRRYVKFMKEILSKKRKLKEFETVALTEECSAILQKKLPPKLKDPGSFTIPCAIGNQAVGRALCDLGASINLMSLSIYRKLGLKEAKPTNISLQLADRSITYSLGIVEDVLVKVDSLIFPADFVVLDFEEDKNIPIILGRPFLATGRTLIDVPNGELIMKVFDQVVKVKVFKEIPIPTDKEESDLLEESTRVKLKDCREIGVLKALIEDSKSTSPSNMQVNEHAIQRCWLCDINKQHAADIPNDPG